MDNPIIFAAAVTALCAAISAVELVRILERRLGATTIVAAQATPLHSGSGLRDLLLLASAAGVSISVAFINRHVHRGAGNRRLPGIVSFMLCVCAGVILFFLFVLTPGGADVDDGAQARALGLVALSVLPSAATVTFYLATMLIVAGHIRSGGEGGGGVVVAVAGEEPIQAPVGLRFLSRMALAAAAGLVCLMAVAVCGAYF